MPRATDHPLHQRLAAGALLILMVAGCAVLWVGIPLGSLWLSSKASDSLAQHFLLALPMTVAAMMLWVLLLAWLNQLYLQVSGAFARIEADERAGWPRRRIRGPLEPLLVTCFFLALGALFVWFFAFAENPSSQVL